MGSRPLHLAVPALLLAAAVAGPTPASTSSAQALTVPSRRPLARSFLIVENQGQFDPAVRFQARAAGMTLWVTETSLWLAKMEPGSAPAISPEGEAHPGAVQAGTGARRGVNLEVSFPGRRPSARLVASDPRPTRMNYFLGSDPVKWRSGVRTYGTVTWRGLYPGISVTLTDIGGEPALAVEASPGADPAALRLRVTGGEAVRATPHGRLVADTAIGPVFLPPVFRGGRLLEAAAHGSEVAFTRASTSSDPSQGSSLSAGGAPPGRGLEYGTFLGGEEDDFGSDLVVGPDGSTYLTGWTYSADFPTTPGAFDRTYDGPGGFGGDAFVSKLDPTGSTLAYSTFVGGSDTDTASSLAVDPDGTAYVGGFTASRDFPTTPGSFSPTPNGSDAFVTRVNPDGAGLGYSTFLGGSSNADWVQALALAEGGMVYVTGYTLSADFPTTPGAFDETINPGEDAFVSALNEAGTDLVYSTFLGGDHNDIGYAIAVGSDGTAYVTGEAQSEDFPTTPGAFDRTFNGGNNDLFVTAVTPDGTALAFSTYLGGNDIDTGTTIGLDPEGNVYVAGHTSSPDYPITPGAYDPTINSFIFSDVFATKLNLSGSALVYSTFLGGAESDVWPDLSVAPDGTLTLTGTTYSGNFPTTPGAFDRTLGGSGDAFVSRFDPTGSALLYSSFLGGTSFVIDEGLALAPAKPGAVSVSGDTSSANFPVTPGAYDPTYNGEADAFVATLRIARTMHVDRIVPRYRPVGSGYAVGAAIRILYEDGSLVRGADVTVEVAYPDGSEVVVTGQTGPRGIASVIRPASDSGTYMFTVLDVVLLGPVYDPSQNRETTDSVTIP